MMLRPLERSMSVIVSGDQIPEVTAGEDSIKCFRDLCKNKLKCSIPANEITSAFRAGREPLNQTPDKRVMIVKFLNRESKDDLLKSCRREKPSGLYINENLIKSRSEILYSLRQAKRQFPERIDGLGSQQGKIYLWFKCADRPTKNVKIFINNRRTLEDFCTKSLSVELSVLVARRPSK